ncbi:uncharacterized protein [Lepeophtheirus salmonis]|uniref:uncharacterized protein n=1 Tax=Lepeophtheirus salmonis TaxID=72036 RepID=UPI003AF3BEA8
MKKEKNDFAIDPMAFSAMSGKDFSTEKVESKCDNLNSYKYKTFWTSDIHDGCRMDFPTILSHLKQRVYVTGKRQKISYIDLFHYPGVMFSDNRSPVMHRVNHYNFPITEEDIKVNTKYYIEHPLKDVDGFYCEFPAALCEIWMPLKKKILFLTAHRYNIGRCTKDSWHKLNANLKIMKNTKNVVGALSRYDVEYMDHYSNLSPDFFPSYSGIYLEKFKYNPKYSRILYFGHVEILDYKSPDIKRQSIMSMTTYENGALKNNFFSTETIAQSRAIIYMAYSVMSYKLTEFYTMGMPLFIPSIKYYINENKGFGNDRVTSTSGFYCKDSSLNDFPSNSESSHPFNPSLIYSEDVESEVFWLQYADFYDWPYIQHFDNISHLHYLIDTVNLYEIHLNMIKEVQIKKQNIFNAWCNVIMEMNFESKNQSSPTGIKV